MTERGLRVRDPGEIAIRCNDLERMAACFGDVLELERMEGSVAEAIAFCCRHGVESDCIDVGPSAGNVSRAILIIGRESLLPGA